MKFTRFLRFRLRLPKVSSNAISLLFLAVAILGSGAYVFINTHAARADYSYSLIETFPADQIDSDENLVDWELPCNDTSSDPGLTCNAGNVGAWEDTMNCTGRGDGDGGEIAYVHTFTCEQFGTAACTPSAACAASTCSTATCSDGCGGTVTGTKDCSAPPVTCQSIGYTDGTYPSCYSTCQDLPDHESGTWPYCFTPTPCTSASNSCGMTNSGERSDYAGDCSASAPPDSECGCTPNSCAASTCTTSTCNNGCSVVAGTKTTGSCSCTPGDCAANTCSTTTCVDSCGLTVNGTKSCTAPSGGASTTPVLNVTATPTRVSSGGSSSISIIGSGFSSTNSCTLTGPGISQNFSASGTINATVPVTAITTQSVYTVGCTDLATTTTVLVNINPIFQPF